MGRTLKLLTASLLALTLMGCHKSSVENPQTAEERASRDRCDSLLAEQEEAVAQMGGWLRCDPSYDPDEPSRATHVMQWNRFHPDGSREPWWYEWDRRVDDHGLALWAWVGVAELYEYHAGHIPDFYLSTQKWGVPPEVEQRAYQFAVGKVGA